MQKEKLLESIEANPELAELKFMAWVSTNVEKLSGMVNTDDSIPDEAKACISYCLAQRAKFINKG